MRSIEQIVKDNGGDNTPALDTHNLTGRAFPEGVEPEWTPLESFDDEDEYEHVYGRFDGVSWSYESWLGQLDCE